MDKKFNRAEYCRINNKKVSDEAILYEFMFGIKEYGMSHDKRLDKGAQEYKRRIIQCCRDFFDKEEEVIIE